MRLSCSQDKPRFEKEMSGLTETIAREEKVLAEIYDKIKDDTEPIRKKVSE